MQRREALKLLALAATGLIIKPLGNAQGTLTLQPLSDNITVLMGAGGNITILKSPEGLLVVDSGLPDTAAAVTGKLQEGGPAVKTLINTHWHFDHTGGNTDVGKSGANIIAHENCAKRLSAPQHIAFLNRDFPALAVDGRPKTTFRTKGKISFGGETVHYQYLPPAHTDGDIILHFANANILSTGDLLFNDAYPFIDYSSGGSIEGMIHNSETLLRMVDGSTKIVPGHGPIGNRANLQEFHDVLADANERVTKLIKEGKSADELVAADPTRQYDEKYGKGFMNPPSWLKMLYMGKTQAAAKTA